MFARFFMLPFPVRLALTCWAILLAAVTVRILVAKPGSHSVVPVYTNAASRWLASEDIYASAPGLDVFLYGPGYAAVFAVFEPLPQKVTDLTWRCISVLLLFSGVWRLTRATALTPRQTGWCFATLAMLSVPCVNNGQPNVMIAGLVTLGFALAIEKRNITAVLVLAIAAGIKLYPIAALLLLIVAMPRLGRHATLCVGGVLLFPFLLQSPDYVVQEYQRLLEAIRGEDRTATMLFRVPHDWTILPRLAFGVIVPAGLTKAISLFAAFVFAVIVHRCRQRLETAFMLASVWMTLFGPSTEIPTYMLAAPAVAWWAAKQPSWPSRLAVALLLVPVLRGMFPTSEVLACRMAAPLGAGVLLAQVVASAWLPLPRRMIRVYSLHRGVTASRPGIALNVSKDDAH